MFPSQDNDGYERHLAQFLAKLVRERAEEPAAAPPKALDPRIYFAGKPKNQPLYESYFRSVLETGDYACIGALKPIIVRLVIVFFGRCTAGSID